MEIAEHMARDFERKCSKLNRFLEAKQKGETAAVVHARAFTTFSLLLFTELGKSGVEDRRPPLVGSQLQV